MKFSTCSQYRRNLAQLFLTVSLLILVIVVSNPVVAEEATDKSANWELKGIKLGMPLSEAKALFPNLKCAEPGTGALRCADENETIVGQKATMMIHALDGVVLSVRFIGLTLPQTQQVLNAIQSKYGEADEYIVRKGSDTSDLFAAWRDGSHRILVEPWAERPTNRIKDVRGEVMLIDNVNFRDKWVPRSYITKPTSNVATDI